MNHIDVLKVSKATKPAAFAAAIYHIFASDENAKLKTRALGMEASHNMFKGIEKAQEYLKVVKLSLYTQFEISYEQLEGNVDVMTVYTLHLTVR